MRMLRVRYVDGRRQGTALVFAMLLAVALAQGLVPAGAQVDPWADEPILFEERFEDPPNTAFGRTPSLTSNAALTFTAGAAELRRNSAEGGVAVRLPGEYGHTSLGVDAWLVEPDVDAWLGLECRTHPNGSG